MSDKTPRINALDNTPVKVSYIDAPFTTVVNRSQMVDLANDMSAHAGVNRLSVQSIFQLQGEKGPGGESVFGAVNDKFGQIRYVGDWIAANDTSGPNLITSDVGDFFEITFYGTDLNLTMQHDNTVRDIRVSIDGAGEGANIYPSGGSAVLNARNYAYNQVLNAASGLTLGLHTAKIRLASGVNMRVYGFEVINESPLLRINPGELINGKVIPFHSSAFNGSFDVETGTDANVGGCVLLYEQDGAIKKAVNWAEDNQLNLTAADHSNEEEISRHNWREFGASRTDDLSTVNGGEGATDRAFTLDDGTTSLVMNDGVTSEEAAVIPGIGAFITLTFVGTGLDILAHQSTVTPDTHEVFVNGVSVGNLSSIGLVSVDHVYKIISGLPYGTHTVKVLRNTAATAHYNMKDFIVYGPKKPTLPVDAIANSSYYLMADFDGTAAVGIATTDFTQQATGIIAKSPSREHLYFGTWSIGLDLKHQSGIRTLTTTNTDKVFYTFWGNGFTFISETSSAGTNDFTVKIDGVLDATGVDRSAANMSSLGGGSYRKVGGGGGLPARLEFTGLSLGLHTIEIEKTAGAGNFVHGVFWLHTPIHSPKLNGPTIIQNTLRIGSQGAADLRNFSESQIKKQPNWTKALAISAPSTSSTSPVPMEDMLVPINMEEIGSLEITLTSTLRKVSGGTIIARFYLYIDGVAIPKAQSHENLTTGDHTTVGLHSIVSVSKGPHIIQVFWNADGAQVVDDANSTRTLTVKRIKD